MASSETSRDTSPRLETPSLDAQVADALHNGQKHKMTNSVEPPTGSIGEPRTRRSRTPATQTGNGEIDPDKTPSQRHHRLRPRTSFRSGDVIITQASLQSSPARAATPKTLRRAAPTPTPNQSHQRPRTRSRSKSVEPNRQAAIRITHIAGTLVSQPIAEAQSPESVAQTQYLQLQTQAAYQSQSMDSDD